MAGLPWRFRGARLADRWQGVAPERSPPTGPTAAGENALPNALRAYVDGQVAGPGLQKWLHYFEIYHRHLDKFVGRRPVVVEVGVFSGGSLPMWRQYFGPGCHVHGIDIDSECEAFGSPDSTIHIGDQADRAMWKRFRETVPRVDVLIDDGGHQPEQQAATLEEMLPHILPGGVYICEDVHGAGNRFAEFACSLCHRLNAGKIETGAGGVDAIVATPFQAAIHSVHWYPMALVIEKRKSAELLFSAPLRGNEWRA